MEMKEAFLIFLLCITNPQEEMPIKHMMDSSIIQKIAIIVIIVIEITIILTKIMIVCSL